MALKDIDKAAESKGSFLVTVWQFVKFIVVSLLAMLVQIALTNLIPLIPAIQEMYATEFNLWVLSYPVNYDEAGAIISGANATAEAKQKALMDAGVTVVSTAADIADGLKEATGWN